jgi:hypothetical protein
LKNKLNFVRSFVHLASSGGEMMRMEFDFTGREKKMKEKWHGKEVKGCCWIGSILLVLRMFCLGP